MKYLLLGGTNDTGKSGAIWRLANDLKSRMGYSEAKGVVPPPPITSPVTDFTVILQGFDKHGNKINILVNSPTDDQESIERLEKFIKEFGGTIDVFISSIRDENHGVRTIFFKTFPIHSVNDSLLEIPLGRINRRRGGYPAILSWHERTLDNLILHTLSNSPFDVL